MKNDIVIILRPINENANYMNFTKQYLFERQNIDLSDYEVFTVPSVVHAFKEQFLEYVDKNGIESLRNSDLILEQLISKGTSDSDIITQMQKYIENIHIDNELIIVDPYFFARPKNTNYISILEQILQPHLGTIQNLIIITGSHAIDTTVKTSIETMLKSHNHALNIVHHQNNDYHDRYWISGSREKGMIIGTSLNSLGNKTALIDRINTSDVRQIISELGNDGLI